MLLTVRAFQRIALLILCGLLPALLAQAQQKTFTLDPAQTKVNFTVDSTLHTVNGDFRLKRGSIQFDNATNQAGGEIVVDSASGRSGSDGRDKKMHKDVLESPKYADIIFTPRHIKGMVGGRGQIGDRSRGRAHDARQVKARDVAAGSAVARGAGTADGSFTVKYQEWGMKSPNTFILRVSDKVQIHVHATGRMAAGASN